MQQSAARGRAFGAPWVWAEGGGQTFISQIVNRNIPELLAMSWGDHNTLRLFGASHHSQCLETGDGCRSSHFYRCRGE